jgi:phosphodiesterase/alkaline phosphatase D-like protein
MVWLFAFLWAQTIHPNRAYVRMSQAPFLHDVTSGDPTQNSVVIWTRVTPPQN